MCVTNQLVDFVNNSRHGGVAISFRLAVLQTWAQLLIESYPTLKAIFTAFLLDAQHQRASMKNKTAAQLLCSREVIYGGTSIFKWPVGGAEQSTC